MNMRVIDCTDCYAIMDVGPTHDLLDHVTVGPIDRIVLCLSRNLWICRVSYTPGSLRTARFQI